MATTSPQQRGLRPFNIDTQATVNHMVFATSFEDALIEVNNQLVRGETLYNWRVIDFKGTNIRCTEYVLPPVRPTDPHIMIEYDGDYFGGNYTGVGTFLYMPVALALEMGLENGFRYMTGLDPNNIVGYDSIDTCTYYTADGEEYKDEEE